VSTVISILVVFILIPETPSHWRFGLPEPKPCLRIAYASILPTGTWPRPALIK